MKKKRISRRAITITFVVSLIVALLSFLFSRSALTSIIALVGTFILLFVYMIVKRKFDESLQIKKMEDVFPDFIQLMASNLRAGMTIDKALLLSSRKEFAPLDKEIMKLGKDIVTGKEIEFALMEMGKRTQSPKIQKTIKLITTGIKSGGNISTLLEETAANMRERNFVEKKAASNVLMYIIFIFFAVSVGAPVLFGLSSVLVQIMTNLLSNIPEASTSADIGLPFALTSVNISVNFVIYFSITFIIVIDILASLILGLVSKGQEKAGVKYFLPIIAISLTAFFLTRIILTSYFSNLFG